MQPGLTRMSAAALLSMVNIGLVATQQKCRPARLCLSRVIMPWLQSWARLKLLFIRTQKVGQQASLIKLCAAKVPCRGTFGVCLNANG